MPAFWLKVSALVDLLYPPLRDDGVPFLFCCLM
jgi:hypothetical protein